MNPESLDLNTSLVPSSSSISPWWWVGLVFVVLLIIGLVILRQFVQRMNRIPKAMEYYIGSTPTQHCGNLSP